MAKILHILLLASLIALNWAARGGGGGGRGGGGGGKGGGGGGKGGGGGWNGGGGSCTSKSDCVGAQSCCDGTCMRGSCPSPATPSPIIPGGCPSSHRHRKSWQESSRTERQLYIDGFKELAEQGITQQFTQTHLDSSEHSNSEFLPWHREYLYRFENAVRDLGGKFACFTLPYWDWSREPIPYDVKWNRKVLFITDSGLGGDGNGQCLDDDVWGQGEYSPLGAHCLVRDLDYPEESGVCTFYSSTELMEVIDFSSDYGTFRPYIEGTPHALPHVCIGGDVSSAMATYYSPDDPIFFLHHCFVDMLWALWQDCNDYDGASANVQYEGSTTAQLDFSPIDRVLGFTGPRVSETFDIVEDYDQSYAKGDFWVNAGVDAAGNCNAGINSGWFYDEAIMADTEVDAEVELSEFDVSSTLSQCAAMEGTPREIGIACCELTQMETDGSLCEPPEEVPDLSVDAVTGQPFERDAETGDIKVTLAQMVAEEYGLPECALAKRRKMFAWAQMMHQLESLQMGCYDPYCDLSAIGQPGFECFDAEEHYDEEASGVLSVVLGAATTPEGVQLSANLMILAMAVVLMMVLAKRATARDAKKIQPMMSGVNAAYGSV